MEQENNTTTQSQFNYYTFVAFPAYNTLSITMSVCTSTVRMLMSKDTFILIIPPTTTTIIISTAIASATSLAHITSSSPTRIPT